MLAMTLAQADIETRRWGPWLIFADDFRPYDGIYKPQLELAAAPSGEEKNVLGEAVVRQLASSAATDNSNRVAETFVRSLEAMSSALLTRYVISQLYSADADKAKQMLGAVTQIASLPDGSKVKLTIEKSFVSHRMLLRMMVHAAHQISTFASLEGAYMVIAEGPLCPIASGAVTVTQHEMLLDVQRDGVLMFIGAVGKDAAYFIANEKRWATTVHDTLKVPAGLEMTVPDQPSELFVAAWDDKELRLKASVRGDCTMVLSRPLPNVDLLSVGAWRQASHVAHPGCSQAASDRACRPPWRYDQTPETRTHRSHAL